MESRRRAFLACWLALAAGCVLLVSRLRPDQCQLSASCAGASREPPQERQPPPRDGSHGGGTYRQLAAPVPCSSPTSRSRPEPPFVVVAIVDTAPARDSTQRRRLARRLHGSLGEHRGRRLRWIFVVPVGNDDENLEAATSEAYQYGDVLLLESMTDGTRLPEGVKTLAAVDWMLSACPGAEFLLRTDDRCVVNPFSLMEHLADMSLVESRLLVLGHLPYQLDGSGRGGSLDLPEGLVQQFKDAEVAPSSAAWMRDAEKGPGYILSREAAAVLLAAARNASSPIPLEPDWLHVILCAAGAGIAPRHSRRLFRPAILDADADACVDWRAIVVRWGDRSDLAARLWQHASAPEGFNPPCRRGIGPSS